MDFDDPHFTIVHVSAEEVRSKNRTKKTEVVFLVEHMSVPWILCPMRIVCPMQTERRSLCFRQESTEGSVDSRSLQHVGSNRCCLYPEVPSLTPCGQSFQHQSRSNFPIVESQLNFSHRSSCPCIVDFLSVEDCLSTADRTKLFMFLPGVYRGERRLTVAPARRLGSMLSVPGGTLFDSF